MRDLIAFWWEQGGDRTVGMKLDADTISALIRITEIPHDSHPHILFMHSMDEDHLAHCQSFGVAHTNSDP